MTSPRDGMTLEQVGKELGVTRERVRQTEANALRKLRAAAAAQGMKAEDVMDVRRPGTD